jgi:pimeloyl-ACP methyl ester carboxylesterase
MLSWLQQIDPAEVAVRASRANLRRKAGLERREARLPDGRTVVYLDSEEAPGGGPGPESERPPLVLVHGIGASKDHWPRLARRLAHRFRIVAPDLPGFGESDKPEDGDYSMTGQAEAVLAFADALGLGAFHLAGSSMGGRIAAELAARHPRRLRTLWLLDPAGAEGERPSEMIEGLYNGADVPIFSRSPEEYEAATDFVMSRPPGLPAFAVRVLAAESAAAYDLNLRIFRQMSEELAARPSTEELLRGVAVPTLVTWGEEDRVLHASGAATIAAAMPDASVHLMHGVGHLPLLEDPDLTAAAYLDFLDARPAPPSRS